MSEERSKKPEIRSQNEVAVLAPASDSQLLTPGSWSFWLRSILSEPDGSGSFARLASLVMLLLQVANYIRTGIMPDWQTLAACGAPYAVNKASTQMAGAVKR